jgi:hypothetical protein
MEVTDSQIEEWCRTLFSLKEALANPQIGEILRSDTRVCNQCSRNGFLPCLRLAHENGCPWDEETALCAAKNDRVKCLRYLHENGCPWDERICRYSTGECQGYLHEGHDVCPFNSKKCIWWGEGGV